MSETISQAISWKLSLKEATKVCTQIRPVQYYGNIENIFGVVTKSQSALLAHHSPSSQYSPSEMPCPGAAGGCTTQARRRAGGCPGPAWVRLKNRLLRSARSPRRTPPGSGWSGRPSANPRSRTSVPSAGHLYLPTSLCAASTCQSPVLNRSTKSRRVNLGGPKD